MTPDAGNPSGRRYTIKQRVLLATVPPVLAGAWKLLELTCRHETRGEEHLDACRSEYDRALAAFWHESAAMALYHHRNRGHCTLASQSFDGELAARVAQRFGIQALRGSSSRGGAKALRDMQQIFDTTWGVGFPLDGPRGPRRRAKIGVAALAARTATAILPQAFAAVPAWRLNSWDKMPIPKPFARVIAAYGPPIPPPPDTSREALETTRLRVETELNRLHAELEEELA